MALVACCIQIKTTVHVRCARLMAGCTSGAEIGLGRFRDYPHCGRTNQSQVKYDQIFRSENRCEWNGVSGQDEV